MMALTSYEIITKGDGVAPSGMGDAQNSNMVNDVGKDNDGVKASPSQVTPGNSAVNKEDNLHDENDVLKNKGTSYANLFTGEPSKKALNLRTLFTPGETGLMWVSQWSLLELLVNSLLITNKISKIYK
ncbi:hypothetical protein Tco_1127178 [Tanacetum coccineum]